MTAVEGTHLRAGPRRSLLIGVTKGENQKINYARRSIH